MRAITTQATSFKLRHLLDHAYLREQYHRGNIVPVDIDGTANPADIGTKNLPADSTERYATYIWMLEVITSFSGAPMWYY